MSLNSLTTAAVARAASRLAASAQPGLPPGALALAGLAGLPAGVAAIAGWAAGSPPEASRATAAAEAPTAAAAPQPPPGSQNAVTNALNFLVKYIPTEALTLYIAALSLTP